MFSCALLLWTGVGLHETWYATTCFLLATTVTGGEDLTGTGDSCREEAGCEFQQY